MIFTLSRSTSVINIPNSEHIHASDKYILSFISVRSFANKKGLRFQCMNRFGEVAAIPFFTVSVNCNLHFDGPKHFEQYCKSLF